MLRHIIFKAHSFISIILFCFGLVRVDAKKQENSDILFNLISSYFWRPYIEKGHRHKSTLGTHFSNLWRSKTVLQFSDIFWDFFVKIFELFFLYYWSRMNSIAWQRFHHHSDCTDYVCNFVKLAFVLFLFSSIFFKISATKSINHNN